YELNRVRVARMLQEWQELVEALQGADLALIPLKGIALVQNHYADRATRPLADLDVLIRPEDLGKTRAAFDMLGYMREDEAAKPNFVRPDNRWPICMDGEHPDNPRRVEVHTRLEDEFRGSTIDGTSEGWRTSNCS